MIVKVCGIKTVDTLLCCEKNNVNFFGMIFYPKSPRNIQIKDAKELQNISLNLKIKGVGVVVDEKLEYVIKLIDELKLEYIQLHGKEDNDYIMRLKERNVKVIKKISINSKNDLKISNKFSNADFYLFDYKPNKHEMPGGNAKKFDWNIIQDIEIDKPWFLSGGVNCYNIELIKREIKPFAVDLSSGLEKKLGIKDNQIINNFMDKKNNA